MGKGKMLKKQSQISVGGRLIYVINSFLAIVPILYPLKTLEKPWFSRVFRGI